MKKLTLTLIILFPFFWANGQPAEVLKLEASYKADTLKIEKRIAQWSKSDSACFNCILKFGADSYKSLVSKYYNAALKNFSNKSALQTWQKTWDSYRQNTMDIFITTCDMGCDNLWNSMEMELYKKRSTEIVQLYKAQLVAPGFK